MQIAGGCLSVVCIERQCGALCPDTRCQHAGMRLIQLLPVNDTSVNMMWWDSYPYSSLSVRPLHDCDWLRATCNATL